MTNGNSVYFNKKGELLKKEIKEMAPYPVGLSGPTGWGKTVLAREVAKELGQEFTAINLHRGMNIDWLIGAWHPMPIDGGGITIEWRDGVLTDAIRTGKVFLAEELTRAPEDAVSRLFGLLDSGFRTWTMPEGNMRDIPVDDRFWFIATYNPVGRGYQTSRLDTALNNRFVATFPIVEAIADEEKILADIVDNEDAKTILKFTKECRDAAQKGNDAAANLPTRDVVMMGRLMAKGYSLVKAVELGVAPKYPEIPEGLVLLAEAHTK